MSRYFGIIQFKKSGKLEIVNHTFKGRAVDGIFYFGKHKEKWLALRAARLDLILERYGHRHPSVSPISRML